MIYKGIEYNLNDPLQKAKLLEIIKKEQIINKTPPTRGGGNFLNNYSQELPSAFRNLLTPITNTGYSTLDTGIGLLANVPDLFINAFDGIKGTSIKDKINLERGYPELVHEDSYQFNLENRYGRFDPYKPLLIKKKKKKKKRKRKND